MYHRRVEDPALCLRAGEPINSDDKMVIRTAEGLTENVYIVFDEISEIEPNRPALVASTMSSLPPSGHGEPTQISHIAQIGPDFPDELARFGMQFAPAP